ncbi:13114_t:CDS:2, partial [Funneliformis caledonium]
MKLLRIPEYHSSEESETDQKNDEGKRQIVVYNYFWRSNENLLRNVFEKHVLLQQLAQLTRPQIYDEIRFCKNVLPSKNAPSWASTDGYDRSLDYSTEEEHIYGESSITGMIRGVILQNEQDKDVLQYDDIPRYDNAPQGDDNYDDIPQYFTNDED